MSTLSPWESSLTPDKAPLIEIELIPLEEDDLDTIAAIEEVAGVLRDEIIPPGGYALLEVAHRDETESEKARGGVELFQLIAGLTQTIHDQQDTIKIIIGAGVSVLGLLLKQRRVKKLEVTLGRKTLRIEKADQQVVQRAMEQFEALCREEEKAITPESQLKVKVQVSKNSSPKNIKTKRKKSI